MNEYMLYERRSESESEGVRGLRRKIVCTQLKTRTARMIDCELDRWLNG